MCGSMVDIQSSMAEIRRGKKKREKIPQGKNKCPLLLCRAAIKNSVTCLYMPLCTAIAHNAAQNSSDNFPLLSQMIIIAQTMSTGVEERRGSETVKFL